MGVDMLAAYYDRSVNTKELFQSLKIKSTKDYEKHLNQYECWRDGECRQYDYEQRR